MFSVGAEPFNSRSRQLYGGWALDEAQAIQDPMDRLWAEKKYFQIAGKLAPNAAMRRLANIIHQNYVDRIKADPALKDAFRKVGRRKSRLARAPMLDDDDRVPLWNDFVTNMRVPGDKDAVAQRKFAIANRGPMRYLEGTWMGTPFPAKAWQTAGLQREIIKARPPITDEMVQAAAPALGVNYDDVSGLVRAWNAKMSELKNKPRVKAEPYEFAQDFKWPGRYYAQADMGD